MEDLRPVGGMGPRAHGKVKGSFGRKKGHISPRDKKKGKRRMIQTVCD